MSTSTPTVKIHPQSWKQIRKGHPWIIKDQYTQRFSRSLFIQAIEKNLKVIMLNDPAHPKIKARVWEIGDIHDSFNLKIFRKQLYSRLEESIRKRVELLGQRENIYLVFGEADFLPGLFIQKMGEVVLIQLYTDSYKDNMKVLLQYFKEILKKEMPEINWKGAFIQHRSQGKSSKVQEFRWHREPLPQTIGVKEFGIQYQVRFNDFYDQGLYTDMSGVRDKLKPLISKSQHFLNLYSYTGAYSLFALSLGVTNVISVDLSAKYLQWLEENIKNNPELSADHHQSIANDVIKYLKVAKSNQQHFDFIVCDPPSFSSNGKSATSAFKQYEVLLPLCLDILQSGGKVAIFLNTHSITKNKFLKKVEEILREYKHKTSIVKHLTLEQDCPRKIGFPEGDYLKGFLIEKK